MDERSRRIERAFSPWLMAAALLVVPLLVIEESGLGKPWSTIADILNWGTWLVFLVETVVMLAVVPDKRRWLREHPVDLIIVIFSPPVLPADLQAARFLRLLRLLRLLSLARVARSTFSITGVRFVSLLAFLTILSGGAAFAEIEHKTAWQGVYWAVTTMTTVGYGDLAPSTDGAKVIAIAVMLVGVSFVAVITGAIAQRFLAADIAEVELEEGEVEQEVQQIARDIRDLSDRMARLEQRVRGGR
jgi:voltage-gated potassium channel